MESLGEFLDVFGLTFPDDEDFPAVGAEFAKVAFVAVFISLTFGLPEFYVCGRFDAAVTAVMDVPETASLEGHKMLANLGVYIHNRRRKSSYVAGLKLEWQIVWTEKGKTGAGTS